MLDKNDIKIERFYVTRKENNPSNLFEIPVEVYHAEKKQGYIIIAVSEKYQKDILQQIESDERKRVFLLQN